MKTKSKPTHRRYMLTCLLAYIEARRPSTYAPWREFELKEMEAMLPIPPKKRAKGKG